MPLNEPHAEVVIGQHDLALPVSSDFIGGDGISARFIRAIICKRKPRGQQGRREGTTKILPLTVAWGFVCVPPAWGVLQTLTNALKLFQ